MYFNVIHNCLKYYILDVFGLNYNSIHANYECDNFNFFDKKCMNTM